MSSTDQLRAGLVSITFRAFSPERIIELASANGLSAIEWGGDVHCPPGELATARRVCRATRDAGLTTYAYGSYYRAGASTNASANAATFAAVLATAVELRAPAIRVWAGTVGSAAADAIDRCRVVDDLRATCAAAAREGVGIALEYHDGTLTDCPGSATALLGAVGQPNLFTYWQPRHGLSIEENLADLAALRPWLRDVHAFHWWPTPADRLPLADGVDRWRRYANDLRSAGDGRPRVVALEFVRGDRVEQLADDARALRSLLPP